ncbi:hypothetical protein [Bradyrhizobium sp.]|uniref:hypothetical protein n=1 Tax=Bradyrhizobium sp. TaxID=376 RepID=UPI001D277287|nr:hypothetical protein [Bradyrhizobium sp.]MBI5319643.1 hypothetical protein [Bradyrhizobium sp.]
MAFDVHGEAHVRNFLAAISPWESGYLENSFTYVATRLGNDFVLAQGMLWLRPFQSPIPLTHFESENVRAGHFKLSDVGKTYREVIKELGEGYLTTPHGTLLFPSRAASFTPLHPAALQSQSRLNVLKITGAAQLLSANPSVLDWELRSSPIPFDTVQELLSEYGLGGLFNDFITVEVIATPVMGFDGDECRITEDKAHIAIRLAPTLDAKKVSVGYREINPGTTVKRGSLAGSQFVWTQEPERQVGTFDLAVSKAALLHCYAIYNGVAQTHWFITDPTTSQNARRVVVETFDPGLTILTEFMGRPRGKSYDARDLEAAVAWMFWMLGFSTVQLGSTARTQDFSDVVLVTPQGHLAIVECTVGLLKAGDKLAKLVARHVILRDRLDKSNSGHLKLLPIMVSTLPRAELQADLEQAERLGVLVLAREQLDQIVSRTMIANNPDELFQEAEKRVQSAQEAFRSKPETEPELPFEPEQLGVQPADKPAT